jgi:hypothetical protein
MRLLRVSEASAAARHCCLSTLLCLHRQVAAKLGSWAQSVVLHIRMDRNESGRGAGRVRVNKG